MQSINKVQFNHVSSCDCHVISFFSYFSLTGTRRFIIHRLRERERERERELTIIIIVAIAVSSHLLLLGGGGRGLA